MRTKLKFSVVYVRRSKKRKKEERESPKYFTYLSPILNGYIHIFVSNLLDFFRYKYIFGFLIGAALHSRWDRGGQMEHRCWGRCILSGSQCNLGMVSQSDHHRVVGSHFQLAHGSYQGGWAGTASLSCNPLDNN